MLVISRDSPLLNFFHPVTKYLRACNSMAESALCSVSKCEYASKSVLTEDANYKVDSHVGEYSLHLHLLIAPNEMGK